jgi:ubiquinone/menaquinone biosynthesis C-methylase UbiE
MALYDIIGNHYTLHRKADERIANFAFELLGLPEGSGIADIGAGSGNYANAMAGKGLTVFAVDPAEKMTAQALPHPGVKWIRGTAENLPLADKSVDGILVVLAVHHFESIPQAAGEFDRISRTGPIVIFTFDPRLAQPFWLADYFPALWDDAFSKFEPIGSVAEKIANGKFTYNIIPFPLPDDLEDKFMASGWKYPESYLDPEIRNSISAFATADPVIVENGVQKLRKDLESGAWSKNYGIVKSISELDLGYRFITLKRKR